MSAPQLRPFAVLSILAALATIVMKSVAWGITGSAGLLSDALESLVNLLAAVTAYGSIWYASRPADATHTYGHEKIEFFASGLEGVLIAFAGLGAVAIAVYRWISPRPLADLDLGLLLSGIAMMINFAVAMILLHAGRKHNSIVLEADGHHLMSDVLTTIGVLIGLSLVWLTGTLWLDPLMAAIVGLNILITGFRLIRRSFNGLMDHALPPEQQARLREAIRVALPAGTDFHALRTRQAGRRVFAEFHLLVPGWQRVSEAHKLSHQVEDALRAALPDLTVTIHIEPIDERGSWESGELEQLGEAVPVPFGRDGTVE